MNYASKQPIQPKQNSDLQGDILFTIPSEKEREKETARFEIENYKEKNKKHARIYSMYNFRYNNSELNPNPSPRVEIPKEELETSNANNCLVCFEKRPDSVIMECGHGGKL